MLFFLLGTLCRNFLAFLTIPASEAQTTTTENVMCLQWSHIRDGKLCVRYSWSLRKSSNVRKMWQTSPPVFEAIALNNECTLHCMIVRTSHTTVHDLAPNSTHTRSDAPSLLGGGVRTTPPQGLIHTSHIFPPPRTKREVRTPHCPYIEPLSGIFLIKCSG